MTGLEVRCKMVSEDRKAGTREYRCEEIQQKSGVVPWEIKRKSSMRVMH